MLTNCGSATESHLETGKFCADVSCCLTATYLTGGGGGLNGGGRSILKHQGRERNNIIKVELQEEEKKNSNKSLDVHVFLPLFYFVSPVKKPSGENQHSKGN